MENFHVIRAQQFSRKFMEEIFTFSDGLLERQREEISRLLVGKIMATLFYEPSTRTRMSFEAAMLRLGGGVISTENAREFSSMAKGETLEDSIRVISKYCDVIVLRHNEFGSAEIASTVSGVPIINAGDGPGQHPTQALLDVFTIRKELGHIDGIKIAMVGDLANGRTVRSLAYLLSKFDDVKMYFVAPEIVKMNDDIKDHLKESGCIFEENDNLLEVGGWADVIYQTRIQKERFSDMADYEASCGKYVIDQSILDVMRNRSIIMHPLPRIDEIDPCVDNDPRVAYFRQAENGLVVRMALLCKLLGVF